MLKRRQAAWEQAVMKNIFLASLTLAAVIAGPATAANLPYKAPPPLPVAYYDWSGAYVGFNVGGTHYNATHNFPSPGAITPDVTTGDHDAIFGLHASCDVLAAPKCGRASSTVRSTPPSLARPARRECARVLFPSPERPDKVLPSCRY
jgi:hypothetical protein